MELSTDQVPTKLRGTGAGNSASWSQARPALPVRPGREHIARATRRGLPRLPPYMPMEKIGYGMSTVLDPRDTRSIPLMQKIIKATIDAFGTDHVYHCGTFGESDFGGEEDQRLRLTSAKRYFGIHGHVDPKSVWMTDSWMFHTRVFKEGGDFLER